MDILNNEDLQQRAIAAYFRRASVKGEIYQQPASHASYVCQDATGKTYVVLANSYRVLAIYRLRNQGTLRWLRRWPAAVVAAAQV